MSASVARSRMGSFSAFSNFTLEIRFGRAFRPSRIREERVECVDFGMSAESYYVYEIQPVSSRAFRWADREQEIVGSNRREDSKMDQLNGSSCRISRTTWSACAGSKSSTPKSASGNSAGLNAQHTCLV